MYVHMYAKVLHRGPSGSGPQRAGLCIHELQNNRVQEILQIPFSHGHVNLSLTLLWSRVEPGLINMGLTRLHVHVKGVKGYRFQIFSNHPKAPLQNTYIRMYLFLSLAQKYGLVNIDWDYILRSQGNTVQHNMYIHTYTCMLTVVLMLLRNGTHSPDQLQLAQEEQCTKLIIRNTGQEKTHAPCPYKQRASSQLGPSES